MEVNGMDHIQNTVIETLTEMNGQEINNLKKADIVLSGIACRMPESDNIDEFREHLYNGDDMITQDDRRWIPGLHGIPKRCGKLKDLTKFDASFFGVHPKQANTMDPQLRLLLEVTYEAIVDAGVNPYNIRGSKTGVFIGCSASESHEAWSRDPYKVIGYEMTGCTRSMFANRLSYFFDFKGPSFAVDTACSSSLLAMDQAVLAIRNGLCDAAIVGGSNLCLKPETSLQFVRLGMLSPEGSCKSFDASGNGYSRSEAIVAVYLQKAPNAKRIYASIIHSKNNSDGYKEQGITFPSGDQQMCLLKEVYSECGVNPSDVFYVEAHGTGTKVGDPQEINSIARVFCANGRKNPLVIGSTKSNMGHPEPASGLAALTKVVISMETGIIPANLHFNLPNPDIKALTDGSIQVASVHTPLAGSYVAINSFGFGGSNVHAVLRVPEKKNKLDHPASQSPRLFVFASRTEEGVGIALDKMKQNGNNLELQALLEDNALVSPVTHPYRGYCLINQKNNVQEIQLCKGAGRPLWYVFSGMGTQWVGMGRDLLSIDIFRESIVRSDKLLQLYDIQLLQLLSSTSPTTFENTLHSFVALASIQVALVDLLSALGVKPDGIVGHSVGELACGYADGCLTAEQTVLAAYWRGRCVQEAKLPAGGMAAIGMTWQEAKARCPEGVVPACHNSEDSVTVSGPADLVSSFVDQLQAEGVFARNVNSAGVAFHSYFMKQVAPALREALAKVIPEPATRSKRWVSSSIPASQWDSDLAQSASVDYLTNNLLSPVLFCEALQHVPRNAIVIEIAPHCLLQAILKRSLGSDCTFASLMKKGHADNLEYFWSNIGKIYMSGVNVCPLKLFPIVQFPVSQGTPMLSSLIRWDHSQSWEVLKIDQLVGDGGKGTSRFDIDLSSRDGHDAYLTGHKIDSRVLFPATGYLVLAWKAFAMQQGQGYEQLSCSFEDVHIQRATVLPKTGVVSFEVSIAPVSGRFEISENGSIVATGCISTGKQSNMCIVEGETSDEELKVSHVTLSSKDIYRELRLRGYEYGPTFQGIRSASNTGNKGQLQWVEGGGQWVVFLDTMLQMFILSSSTRGLRLPTRIRSLTIDVEEHARKIIDLDESTKGYEVSVDAVLGVCIAGGVQITGLHASVAPRRQMLGAQPQLEKYSFVPYSEYQLASKQESLHQYFNDSLLYVIGCVNKLLNNGITEQLPHVEFLRNQLKHLSDSVNNKQFNEDKFSSYLNDSTCLLASLLHDIFSKPHDDVFVLNARNLFDSRWRELKDDKLCSFLSQSKHLKSCVDIAIENCIGSKVRVADFESDLYKRVSPLLNLHPLLEVDYCLLNGAADENEQKQCRVRNVVLNDKTVSTVGQFNLVIAEDIHLKADLKSSLVCLSSLVSPQGFLLLHEITQSFPLVSLLMAIGGKLDTINDLNIRSSGLLCDVACWTELLNDLNFDLVAEKSDGIVRSFLLFRKRCSTEIMAENREKQLVIETDIADFSWVPELVQLMQDSKSKNCPIWLKNPSSNKVNGVVGLANCLRREPNGQQIRCILDMSTDSEVPMSEDQMQTQMAKDLAINIFYNGQFGSFRHESHLLDHQLKECDMAFVNVLTRGDLSSLQWVESPLKYYSSEQHTNRDLCNVHYASLNFRDVMLASGRLPPDAIPGNLANEECLLGMEFSGTDSTGKRVMGLLPAKGLATVVDVDRRFLWPVPEAWSLEQAATVPVVYATVYYALVVRGRIRRGEKVLVHSGSGGVGQAAISVALHHGCEVFTTVGSQEKREFLKHTFPQLTDKHIANSRDTSFEWQIRRATKGHGVDVVLNSLAEDKLQASVKLLAQHGRFLEIGKYDLSNDTPLGMGVFLHNVTFHGVLLDALFDENNCDWEDVSRLLTKGIEEGAVRPLMTRTFERDDLEEAFRFMAQGKHIGKVLLKVRGEQPSPVKVKAIPRTTCDPRKAYLVVGGLGGFGIELCSWLVEHGARHLILVSRSGITNGYQSRRVREWRETGVTVILPNCDVTSLDESIALFSGVGRDIGGVFNLAMVLSDGLMENQSIDSFQRVCQPKVQATINLDKVTRESDACRGLEWFVVFSSVSCGRGNGGQANYGFANSVMERICEQRHRDGLPGVAIQWGAVGDVGVVMETLGSNDVVIGGTVPQRIWSCLSVLEKFLNQPEPVVSSLVLAEKSNASETVNKGSILDTVAHILGLKDVNSLNMNASLSDLGLDSLMGVELRQTLERDYGLELSMKEIRALTIGGLQQLVTGGGGSMSSTSSETTEVTVTITHDGCSTGGSDILLASHKLSSNDFSCNVSALQRYDPSSIMPRQTVVKMNQAALMTSSPSSTALFAVHPIEGVVTSMIPLMSQLSYPVYGLQCTLDCPLNSVSEMAAFYLKNLRALQPSGPYRLCGYSFGACVALEMALQLVAAGERVERLYLLDGSHRYVAAHTMGHKEKFEEDKLAEGETEAMCAFLLQFINIDYMQLKTDLISKPDRNSRIQYALKKLEGVVPFGAAELSIAAEWFGRRILVGHQYQPVSKLAGVPIVLVKATVGRQAAEVLGNDYGLSEVCDGPIEVHSVEGDHLTFIQGQGATEIAQLLCS